MSAVSAVSAVGAAPSTEATDPAGASARSVVRAGPRGLPARLHGTGRCLVIGVLNVTPDSFSDGGRWPDAEAAVRHGLELAEQGADLVDVGGESTRPGAERVPEDEELRRTIPVVRALAAAGVAVSVDTMRAVTARASIEAGAVLVNDVSGGLADPGMLPVVAELRVPVVLMHWRGPSAVMAGLAHYDDVVAEVCGELSARLQAAAEAGVAPERVVLDPGLGFAKDAGHSWALLAHLDALLAAGRPVLVGASRKRFLGSLLARNGEAPPPEQRDEATCAVSALAAAAGAWAVRVHDVPAGVAAVRVAAAWEAAR